jgi:hypothetical protein
MASPGVKGRRVGRINHTSDASTRRLIVGAVAVAVTEALERLEAGDAGGHSTEHEEIVCRGVWGWEVE